MQHWPNSHSAIISESGFKVPAKVSRPRVAILGNGFIRRAIKMSPRERGREGERGREMERERERGREKEREREQ